MSFTDAVAAYMNKQIAELAMVQQKQVVSIIDTSEENPRKQAWIDKWDYS